MTTTNEASTRGQTPKGRVSYPHLFTPQKNAKDPTKPAKYSVTMLFPKSADLSALKVAIEAAIKKTWPNKRPKVLKMPIRDGDLEKEDPAYAGMFFVTFRTNEDTPPVIKHKNNKDLKQEDGVIYSGCYARVAFSTYTYEAEGNVGVAFGLNGIQFMEDGERLDGRPDPESMFDALEKPEDEAAF